MPYAPFDLTGHVALVTGGNRGIGFGMAEALARAGADVAICGRDAGRNDEAAARLREYGGRVLAVTADVGVETDVVDLVSATVSELGRLDSAFVNAGIGGMPTPLIESTTEDFERVRRVNLDGAFWTLREAARHMVQRAKDGEPGGSLIGVASLAAIEAAPRQYAYAASKAALIAMVKGAAVELARHHVRANVIAPGWIATDMTAGAQSSPVFAEKVVPRIPARRWGEPDDFGGVAVYLASDASRYHTADVLVVDGGYATF
jgi:NAD(P)-dependent dehydrogenase (short-subunit alcohol dehydrogenase family)